MNAQTRTQIAVKQMTDFSLTSHLEMLDQLMTVEVAKASSKAETTTEWEKLRKLYRITEIEISDRLVACLEA